MKLDPSSKIVKFNWKNFLWITLVHVFAFVFSWQYFSLSALFAFLFLYYLTGMIGITFGFHRLLTHKGFYAPGWLKKIAATCGTLCCQGGPISWIGQHRLHHVYSDTPNDPHNAKRGFWYSHIGYIFWRREDLNNVDICARYCPDISKNSFYRFLEDFMIPLQFLFGIVLLLVGGFFFGETKGFDSYQAMSFVTWGVFVRLVVVYNVTWLINSASHLWGGKPNKTKDEARNNLLTSLLSFGEGWHNNHHAQPRSARHGWYWYQFDPTWILICVLKFFGIVKNVQVPRLEKPKHVAKNPLTNVISSDKVLDTELKLNESHQ